MEYLVDKDHQVAVEPATLYDEEKELGAVIVDIRKRYDQTKIETTRLEKAIANLEEEKVYLNTQFDMIQKETNATKAVSMHQRRIIASWRRNTSISKIR